MVARRAWILTMEVMDGALFARAHEQHWPEGWNRPVVGIFPPRATVHLLTGFMKALNCLVSLTLEEQRDLLTARGNERDRFHTIGGHGVHIYLMAPTCTLRAHKSRIMRTEYEGDDEFLVWKPDSYREYFVDPQTRQPTPGEMREFPEIRAQKLKFSARGFAN